MIGSDDPTVRPLLAGDIAAVRALFDATLVLGRPLGFALAARDDYGELCLGWYLRRGRADAAVAVAADGSVVGYALVCLDPVAHRRHARTQTARLARRVAVLAAAGRLDRASRRFYSQRLRDAAALARSPAGGADAHAHVNVAAGRRSGATAIALRDHVDARCAAAGVSTWLGEVNATVGSRERGLVRVGFRVAGRTRNHTLTHLLDRPIDRLTVVRRIDRPL